MTGPTATWADGEHTKLLPNESFGFQRITVERPLRHADGQPVTHRRWSTPTRSPSPATSELKALEAKVQALLAEVTE